MGEPQTSILAGPGDSAIFLTYVLGRSEKAIARVRELCAAVPGLVRSVAQRDAHAALSCVVAIGSDAWPRLMGTASRPAQLRPFRPFGAGIRRAPATPGDLFFHIRAERADFCHELARILTERLENAAELADEVHGFSYLDSRDLIGFVDGTENPVGEERVAATIVGDEDPAYAGGSYLTVQRYVTDFAKWKALSTEEQEAVIGRTKTDDLELDDDHRPASSHVERTKIVRDGVEQKILRYNRPYGTTREAGTLFIAYARDLSVTEEMLERMFVPDAQGVYDHLTDFSHPVTGNHFFAPSRELLESLADIGAAEVEPPAEPSGSSPSPATRRDASLGIGSLLLRGDP